MGAPWCPWQRWRSWEYPEFMNRRFLATPDAVAETVREGREQRGWTAAQLAADAGVDERFIADVEACRAWSEPELDKVLAVLEALDVYAVALPSIAPSKGPTPWMCTCST